MSGSMGGSRGRSRNITAKVDELLLWKNMVKRTAGVSRKKVYLVKQRERMLLLGSCRLSGRGVVTCTKIHQSRDL